MADQHKITLLMSELVTHDVKRFVITKPPGFRFQPGQGVELTISQTEWKEESRPFTPTSLVEDQALEFIIKSYPAHKGVTQKLHSLAPGAELLVSEPFGTIGYRGPGVFLAGGAGVTPFIAILRERARAADIDSSFLIFSNKAPIDIICENELRHYFGERCILTCTAEKAPGYEHRRIDKAFLAEKIDDFNQPFYVCGPPGFMDAVNEALGELGANPQNLVFEE